MFVSVRCVPALPSQRNFSSDTASTVQGEGDIQLVAERTEHDDRDKPSGVATHATLRYLGQASLRIVTPEGKVIYVDPYAGTVDDYSLPADLILVTHNHFDHCAVDKVTNRAEGCKNITHEDTVEDGRHPTFELGYVTVVPVQAGFNSLHDVNAMVVYPGEDIELS